MNPMHSEQAPQETTALSYRPEIQASATGELAPSIDLQQCPHPEEVYVLHSSLFGNNGEVQTHAQLLGIGVEGLTGNEQFKWPSE